MARQNRQSNECTLECCNIFRAANRRAHCKTSNQQNRLPGAQVGHLLIESFLTENLLVEPSASLFVLHATNISDHSQVNCRLWAKAALLSRTIGCDRYDANQWLCPIVWDMQQLFAHNALLMLGFFALTVILPVTVRGLATEECMAPV